MAKKRKLKEFDKYRGIKYLAVWFAIVGGTVTILKVLEIQTNIIIFVIIIVILLISNYLKDKEIEHLKGNR